MPKRRFNDFRIEGEVAYVDLTDRDGVAQSVLIIDAEDLDRLMATGHRISQRIASNTTYARTRTESGKIVFLHGFILGFPEGVIDHINSNGLDNRKANLRVVDYVANGQNRKGANRNNTTGVRNVSFSGGSKNKYIVRLFRNRKIAFIAKCKTLNIAAITAEMARVQLWGPTAA